MNVNIVILWVCVGLTVTTICYCNKTINLVLMTGIGKNWMLSP